MSYKFLSTIQAISATFTGNSVYSNSTPNRTVKVDATGLYLSRTSDGAYPSSITADGSMYYDTRNSHIFRNDGTASMTLFDNTRNVGIGTTTDAGYKLDVNGTSVFRAQLTLVGNLSTGGNRNYIIGNNGNFEFTTNTYFIFRNYYNSGDQYLVMDYPNGGRATFSGTAGIGYRLAVGGAVTASTSLAQGLYTNPTLYAAANNDVLVGLDVNPTFTNGAYTGVTNLGLRAYSGFRLFTGGAAPNSHYFEGISTSGTNTYLNIVRNGGANGVYAYYLNNGVAYLSVDNGSGETRLYANSGGYYLTFFSNGVEKMRIPTTGNVLIGTTTDAGYKLNVNGTQLIQFGSTEVGLQMTHSNGNTASIVIGNGSAAGTGNVEFFRNGEYVVQYTGSYVAFRYANLRARNNTTLTLTGGIGYGTVLGTSIRLAPNTSDGGGYTATSGTQSTVVMGNSSNEIWQPSSGNATYNLFTNSPVINTSGTYAGIVRGFYYSPTLTSVTGVTHRAIETTTGDVIFNSTSGSVGIGTTSPSYKLDVNGTGRVQTSFTIGGAADGTLFFPNTTSGHQMRIYTQYASNAMVLYANGYNLNLNGAGSMTSNFCTTITGSNGSAALTVQQGNVAWSPVLVVNAIGSTGTRFNTNGNVLIGTTTDAGYKLDVNGTARATTVITNTITTSGSTTLASYAGTTYTYGPIVADPSSFTFTFQSQPILYGSISSGYVPKANMIGMGNSLIYQSGSNNILINSTTDTGYKLQVQGNVNINTASTTNNLVVNADTSMFYNLTSGGGQVKSNVYTTSKTTRYYVPPLSTEYLIEWDPTLCQGIFVDYVILIQGPNFIRSGTLVIANDNGGNVTITDNINSSVNGSSTAFVTFSTAGLASIKLGCNNLLAANDVYVNIVTRYIPNIY